jgi:hypothetical protein
MKEIPADAGIKRPPKALERQRGPNHSEEGPFIMADSKTITIPLRLPSSEAMALAQLVKRVSYDDCVRLSSSFDRYNGRAECDVMWSALNLLRAALAEVGFAPR